MFKFRKASPGDIPLIRELTFKVWPLTYAGIISPEQIDYMLNMMYSESSLKQQMEEGCHFIVEYDEEEPCGFASFQEIRPSAWKLHKIYILPDRQGQGAGKSMISHIIHTIQQQGATSLQLQVNRHNQAKKFYEGLGFTVTGEADFDIGEGWFMNDYIMEKKL